MKKIILVLTAVLICFTAACSAENKENINTYPEEITVKKSYVDELIKMFGISGTPEYTVDDTVKKEFEQRLGKTLPDDYYEFLNAFGYAIFSDYLTVTDPFVPDGIESYFEEYDFNKYWYYDAKSIFDSGAKAVKDENGSLKIISDPYNLFPNINLDSKKRNDTVYDKLLCIGFGYPYDFFENDSGLVFWGYTDDCQFYWNFSGDDYTVVVYCDDEYYEYDMSFSEFLYHYLNGNIIDFEFDPDEELYTYKEIK